MNSEEVISKIGNLLSKIADFLEVPPRFELGNKGFADLCLTTWLWYRDIKIGADDGARTRYLHLGKVALYQMSYTRISVPVLSEPWCLRSESNQRHADFQSAALPTELQRHMRKKLPHTANAI